MRRRVVVVDDSAICREQLHDWLEADGDLQVIGEAADGDAAIEMITRLRPDVATIDLRMPGMSGLELVSYLMARAPLPILVLTGEPTQDEAGRAFEAVRRGALDLLIKPSALDEDAIRALRAQVRWLATVPVVRHIDSKPSEPASTALPRVLRALPDAMRSDAARSDALRNHAPLRPMPVQARSLDGRGWPPAGSAAEWQRGSLDGRGWPPAGSAAEWQRGSLDEPMIVGIAASAGGPTALARVLGSLSPELPISLAIVQHLPKGFAPSFVSFLEARCALQVKLAEHGMVPKAGVAVLAPDDHHLELVDGRYALVGGPPVEGHRPAGTVLLRSLASLGASAIGVVLSGIGRDGADGLRAMRERHATTFAQDASTSVVYGMPRAALEEGGAQHVLPVGELGEAIAAHALSPWRRRQT